MTSCGLRVDGPRVRIPTVVLPTGATPKAHEPGAEQEQCQRRGLRHARHRHIVDGESVGQRELETEDVLDVAPNAEERRRAVAVQSVDAEDGQWSTDHMTAGVERRQRRGEVALEVRLDLRAGAN